MSTRRLAAILAADVVSYSRMMGADEEGTLARLKAHRRELIDPKIAEHRGRIVKTTGDGMLVEFASAVDAVRCAVESQERMSERNASIPSEARIVFRIGINLGDIIIDGDDIHGDGVNVAARLEAEAPAGGIVLAGAVHDAVSGRVKATFEDLGELALKNIERPVRAYRVRVEGAAAPAPVVVPAPADVPLALPDKPSIAVLPFQNMSGDPEQEYFADGIVEDIITALSRFKSLFVIARNSSFTYKGKAVDIKQVGRELGVRYVLEGSVRKASGRLRITGQLLDAVTGMHLWAERFDAALEDVFDVQDRIASGIVSALDQSITSAEIARALRKPTSNLGASDWYYRAMAEFRRFTRESVNQAEILFAKAAEADPNFAAAYGMATWCQIARKGQGWTTDFDALASESRRLAALAWNADKEDAYAIGVAGYALAYVDEDLETGKAWIEKALAINPNVAFIWWFSAAVNGYLGHFEEAIEQSERAIRLSPRDTAIVGPRNSIASGHFYLGRFSEAVRQALATLRQFPKNVVTLRMATASLAMSGDLVQAKAFMARLLEADPTLTQANLQKRIGPFRPSQARDLIAEGLRRAGLPEGREASPLTLPDKPSIAVLPFQNMSGDPEQDYFADGMVEDIITALSRFKSLFVIARNSSFTYKGKPVDIKRVGRELGVRYVLEGSVRKAGDKVRITGQLIDSETGAHLWADRFDGPLHDVFDLQDQVTTSVVGAVVPALNRVELARAKRKPVESLAAYDCLLRAQALRQQRTREANEEARKLFYKAMEIDPDYSTPYGLACGCYSMIKLNGWGVDKARDDAEVRRLAGRVLVLGQDDAIALAVSGFGLVWVCSEFDSGAEFGDKALAANPNLAAAWFVRGAISSFRGEHDAAIEQLFRACRISPVGNDLHSAQGYLAMAYLFLGKYDEAISNAQKASTNLPSWLVGPLAATPAYAMAGRMEEAHKALARLRQLTPELRCSTIAQTFTYRRPADVQVLIEGLRRAGLPE